MLIVFLVIVLDLVGFGVMVPILMLSMAGAIVGNLLLGAYSSAGTLGRVFGTLVTGARVFALLLLVVAASAQADDGADSVFCAWAQQVIAGTGLKADVVTHTRYEDFVKSKAGDSPLTVQQYWSHPLDGPDGLKRVVSCKMRTAERINRAHPATGVAAEPVARGDGSCELVLREVLVNTLNGIPRQALAVRPDSLRVDPQDTTFIGPMWLKPWPFEPLYRDESGVLHLRSRALYVPFAWWIPMPDRFKGNYYCHLIAPDFLEAVLRGTARPGV